MGIDTSMITIAMALFGGAGAYIINRLLASLLPTAAERVDKESQFRNDLILRLETVEKELSQVRDKLYSCERKHIEALIKISRLETENEILRAKIVKLENSLTQGRPVHES